MKLIMLIYFYPKGVMQVVMMRVLSKMRVIAVKMRLTLMRASMIQVARFSNLQMQKKWTWSLMAFSSMTIVVESQLLMHKQCTYCTSPLRKHMYYSITIEATGV